MIQLSYISYIFEKFLKPEVDKNRKDFKVFRLHEVARDQMINFQETTGPTKRKFGNIYIFVIGFFYKNFKKFFFKNLLRK